MIKKCLNCDNEFKQPEGKREKKFCSDNCRAAFNQKNKSEYVRVSRETWERMKTPDEPETKVTDLTGEQKKTNYTIATIKAMCPKELKGLARSTWIFDKRKELGI